MSSSVKPGKVKPKAKKTNPGSRFFEKAIHTSQYSPRLLGMILFVFAFLLYFNTLTHHYALDDKTVITENKYVLQGLASISTLITKAYWYGYNNLNEGSYRPIPLLTFALEYEIFKENPVVSHLINVLLYALSGILLYITLKKWLNRYNYMVPFIASLLFIAHPVHTEVVANIKGRDELLCFCGLLGTLFYLSKYLENKKVFLMILSTLCFLGALLSKETAVAFLLIIPLTVFFFRNISFRRILKLTVPFAVVVAIYWTMRNHFLEGLGPVKYFNSYFQYAPENSDRLATAVFCLYKYIMLLIFPYPLVYDYSYNTIPLLSWGNLKSVGSMILCLGLLVLVVLNLKKKVTYAYCILYFFIMLSLVANIILPMAAIMAERFLYIPSLGYCIIITLLLMNLMKVSITTTTFKLKQHYLFTAVILLLLITYSSITINRNKDWKNDVTIFSSDIINLPDNARAHFNLGREYALTAQKTINQNDKEQLNKNTLEELKKSIEIDPQFYDAIFLTGIVYFINKNYEEAIVWYKKAVAINPEYTDPNISIETAYLNIGICYENIHKPDSALANYHKVLSYKPLNRPLLQQNVMYAYNNLGNLYNSLKEYNNAIKYCKKAVEINPMYENAFFNMANAYINSGNYDLAIEIYGKVLHLNGKNTDAFHNIGVAYLQKGDDNNAITFFEKAIQLDPNFKSACKNMGIIYQRLGDKEKAAHYFKRAS